MKKGGERLAVIKLDDKTITFFDVNAVGFERGVGCLQECSVSINLKY